MKARSVLFGSYLLLILSFGASRLAAQTITVTSANPNNAPQGTVNLNVLINGQGFKKGALAKFFISGTTDPGGISVNSTTFITSGQLNANVNVAGNAAVTKFDIVVALTDGRSGKGTQLFAVTVPDPAIAFLNHTSNFNANPATDYLMVMNADGTNQRVLLQASTDSAQINPFYSAPNWSPDGTQLVFPANIQGSGSGIYIMNKDGTGLHKVIATNQYYFNDPVWSPAPAADGKWKIAFSDQPAGQSQQDLFLVNLDGTGLVNITNSTSSEYYPTWDPYSTRLASQVYPCPGNVSCTSYLYEFNLGLVNGAVGITSSVNLTATGPLNGGYVFKPDWAKTQDKIALQGRLPGANYTDIWVISLVDPTNPVNLTNTPNVSEDSPSWSPDDSKIVFASGGITVMNSDGSGVTQLGVNGGRPDWRRCCPTCARACAP